MNSRLQAPPASGFAANAVNSAGRLCLALACVGVFSAARAATPASGVTDFNAIPTQTVLANASAGAPGATAPNISGWDFTAVSPSSALTKMDVWDGAVSSGQGVAIGRNDSSSADFSVIKVSANDQATFDLEAVGLKVQIVQGATVVAGHSVTLTGLNAAGNAIAGATLTATVNDALLVSFDVSSNPGFNGISAFGVTPVTVGDSIGTLFIDNINALNFATLDNVAPNAPSMPQLAPGSDSGTSSSDNLTNVTTPTFTGTAEAGSTVKLYDTDGLTLLGSGLATGGNWSITAGSLAQGNHAITAKASDAAGNVSAASTGLTVTIDSVTPNVSSVVLPANGSYGEGDHLDFTVNYSKVITVTTSGGTPFLAVNLDTGGSVRASFLFGSGTSALTFRYTVVNGNLDANGIAVASSTTLNGGTLRDTAGNSALLALTGLGSTSGIRVDATPPTVSSINRGQTTPTNLASLSYTVTFSKPVTGVDVSDFTLTTTGTVSALNINLAPVSTSTCTVTISSITGAGTLRLDLRSSGTGIADLAGNAITSGYTAGQPYTVDRVLPVVSSVGVPANGTFLGTQNLVFTVLFSEPVTVSTTGGTPRLPITLDTGGPVNAAYLSGSGSATLTFRYTVVSGNADTDGVTVAAALQANGGTMRDAVGNDATLTLNNVASTAGVLVDAIVPVVSSVTLPVSGTYTAGQALDFIVNYSEAVTVNTGGAPYLNVTLDTGGSVRASYLSGSGTPALVFRYTVVTGNSDLNGIALASSITTNGATLRDASGNNATLTLTGVGATTGLRVDAIAPTVTAINRQTPTAAATNGNTVTFRVTFNESVTGVDAADFTLTTTNSVAGNLGTVNAVSGAIYDVTVSPITGAGTLRLDLNASGTGVSDLAGNAIAAGALGTQLYTIDTVAPTIASVAVPANGTAKTGDNLDFTVTFSESVTVTGAPRLPITLETGGTVFASYASGTGTTKLVFRSTIAAGTQDTDGISLGSALLLNGGTILDLAGNSAVLTLNNVGDTTAVLVDGIAPTVLSVNVPAGGTFKLGSPLDFTVNFSENVTVTGTPRLAVTLDTGGAANVPYLSGSGTSALVFRYTVAAGQADPTGLVLGAAIVANGGALRDGAGNAAVLTLNNVGATAALLVDGIVPTVSSIVRVGSATTNATSLDFTVTFSESVTGVTAASFALTATGTVNATIASVTVTNATTFQVTLNPVSGDGTGRLDLAASGTGIADLAGNAIASGFTTGQVYTLDHTAPAVTGVTVPVNASYIAGQNLDFTVRLSEAVTVSTTSGVPYLPVTLDTGGAVRAAYVSGSGTTALLFRYAVVAGNLDPDGITLGASIPANGGTLRDAAGNDVNLTLTGVPSTVGVLVDAVAPTVLSVSVPAAGTYIKDAVLDFTVTYSEAIIVANTGGTPSLVVALATGGPAQAAYVSGSGSATISFRFTVAAGQQDLDGLAVSSSIALNGGTIRDTAGNDAVLTTPAFSTAAVLVDGVVPAVVSCARSQPTLATTSQSSVKYRVTFNKDVTGLDSSDFHLTATGTAAGTLGSVTAVSGRIYDVAVGALTFGGTIRLDLVANSGITDAVGDTLTATFTSGEIYTLVSNQQPTFTAGSDFTLGQDAGPQTVAAWATNISAGAPGENSQVLNFTVLVDRSSLFTVAPAITPNGTLTFTPNPAASGTATMTVILLDDSDANNASAPSTFTIELTTNTGKSGTYNGLVQAAPNTIAGNDRTGLLRVVIGKAGTFTGHLKLAASTFALRGRFDTSGVASFGLPAATSFALPRPHLPALELTMRLDVTGGTDTLTASLTEDGAEFAVIEADRALYVATKNPVAPFLNVPADLLGRYTVVFAAKTPAEQNLAAEEFPQGDGVGTLFVHRNGVARLTGTLADGTPISCANSLSKANVWPLYAPIRSGKGSVSAPVFFRETADISDLDALDLRWYKPGLPTAKRYPAGWPAGLQVDLIGSKFAVPSPTGNTSIFTSLKAPGSVTRATANFTAGNLTAPGLGMAIEVSPKNVVTVLDQSATRLRLTMLFPYDRLEGPAHRVGRFANGMFRGSFVHPLSNTRSPFKGVIFQKQQSAFGYFLGPTESGAVTLTPTQP